MLPAKYQPNPPGGTRMVFTTYGHGGQLEFRIKQLMGGVSKCLPYIVYHFWGKLLCTRISLS